MTTPPTTCAPAICPTDWWGMVNFYADHLSVTAALNRPAGARRSWPDDLDRTRADLPTLAEARARRHQ